MAVGGLLAGWVGGSAGWLLFFVSAFVWEGQKTKQMSFCSSLAFLLLVFVFFFHFFVLLMIASVLGFFVCLLVSKKRFNCENVFFLFIINVLFGSCSVFFFFSNYNKLKKKHKELNRKAFFWETKLSCVFWFLFDFPWVTINASKIKRTLNKKKHRRKHKSRIHKKSRTQSNELIRQQDNWKSEKESQIKNWFQTKNRLELWSNCCWCLLGTLPVTNGQCCETNEDAFHDYG